MASRYIALAPPAIENISFIFHAMDGLMLTVLMLDSIAWKRPIQLLSQFVFSPNGALTPSPSHSVFGITSQDRYALGTNPQLPASPPLPLSGMPDGGRPVIEGGVDPLLLNVVESLIASRAPTACRPDSRVIPAGLKKIVLASSAAAACPA